MWVHNSLNASDADQSIPQSPKRFRLIQFDYMPAQREHIVKWHRRCEQSHCNVWTCTFNCFPLLSLFYANFFSPLFLLIIQIAIQQTEMRVWIYQIRIRFGLIQLRWTAFCSYTTMKHRFVSCCTCNLAHGSNNNNGMVWHSKCAYSVHICKCDLGNWSSLIKLLNCFETVRKWFYRMQHLNFWILLQQQRNHCPCIGSTNWWLQICERYF